MAKEKTKVMQHVDLFGLAEVKKGKFAVVKVTIEGGAVRDSEIVFEPEDKEYAFSNLRAAIVRNHYGMMEPL